MIWRLLFSGAPFIVVAAAVLLVSVGGCARNMFTETERDNGVLRGVKGTAICLINPARCN